MNCFYGKIAMSRNFNEREIIVFGKFILKLIVLFAFVCLVTSCEHVRKLTGGKAADGVDRSELPKWTVSIVQVVRYPRANPGEKEIPSYNGEGVWIRRHFELNSKLVEFITTIQSKEKDKLDLKLKLDKHGTMIAMRLCNESPQPFWGLLVDGIYWGNINITKATQKEDDYSAILLECVLDKATANMIAKYSAANYEHFHKNDK